jgi:AbiV family abortive infection protein
VKKETIEHYNRFRALCLQNAATNLRGAIRHKAQGENHLVFHLCVLALEETGKIFLGWIQLKNLETGEPVPGMLDMEDHVRKLFWAIWGPYFTREVVNAEQLKKLQGMATRLHTQRLFSLYTNLDDLVPNHEKVTDAEAEDLYAFALECLALAEADGVMDVETANQSDSLKEKFLELTRDPGRRNATFSPLFQEKLVELGNPSAWMQWVVDHFEAETKRLSNLLQEELARQPATDAQTLTPKWRISFRVSTPTHTVRPKINQADNTLAPFVRLRATKDSAVFEVDLDLDQVVPIGMVYTQGALLCRWFVAALSIGASGIFWWNARREPDKYYDKILDLSSSTELSARLAPENAWQWPQRKRPLTEEDLRYTHFIFRYLCRVPPPGSLEFFHHYLSGLAMVASTDIHLFLGLDAFLQFHAAFQKAVLQFEQPSEGQFKDYGYVPLQYIVPDKATFQALIEKAEAMLAQRPSVHSVPTLHEVLLLKSYCDLYIMTLAARDSNNDPTLRLVPNEPTDEGASSS